MQVLSQSVVNGLRLHIKDAEETANFADKFDKFFDILNVKNYTECITKRKQFRQPYRWESDARLEVLKGIIVMKFQYCISIKWLKDFLEWLKNWQDQAKKRTDLPTRERNKLILSNETLLGVRLTGQSALRVH